MGPAGSGDVKVRKVADESVTSSTALQDDNQLVFDVGADETWSFEFWLVVSCTNTLPDIKLAFTTPPGASIKWSGFGDGNTSTEHDVVITAGVSDIFELAGGGARDWIRVRGIVTNGVNPGPVRLQWAQAAPSTSPVIMMQNSYLQASKF
jgi:hypothetical protein